MRSSLALFVTASLLAAARPAVGAPKPEAVAAHQKAMALAKDSRIQEAIASLKEATTLDPTYPEPWADLGNTYLSMGNLSEAVRAFESALQIRPEFQIARYNLAYALRKTGANDRAAQQYRLYLQRAPEDADALYGLAESLRSAGDLAAAADAYDRYAKIEKRPAQAKWVEKAKRQAADLRAKSQAGRKTSTVRAKSNRPPPPKVATKQPKPKKKAAAASSMHLSFSRKGAKPDTVVAAKSASVPEKEATPPKSDPPPPVARASKRPESFRQGLGHLQGGQYEAALKSFNAALRDVPEDAIVLAAIGSAHLGLKKSPEAEKAYRQALRNAAPDALPGIYLGLGEALRLQGERKRAIDAYREAAKHKAATQSVKRISEERIAALTK